MSWLDSREKLSGIVAVAGAGVSAPISAMLLERFAEPPAASAGSVTDTLVFLWLRSFYSGRHDSAGKDC